MSLKLNGVQTRVLLPFLFNSHSFSPQNTLSNHTFENISLWETHKIHNLQTYELLENVQNFLFEEHNYWKVPDATVNRWFKNGVDVYFKKELIGHLKCLGIELFLLPSYGVGLLSFNFEHNLEEHQLKTLNYRISQRRSFTAPTFKLPISEHPNAPQSPAIDVSLKERLGKAGGIFYLEELQNLLLEPFKYSEFCVPYQQFNLFNTLKFSQLTNEIAHFNNEKLREHWQNLLFRLAHIEEETHPGSCQTTNTLLNPHHWVAITSLSTVHFLVDQTLPQQDNKIPFDDQRMSIVFNKYFVHHVVVIFQRLILQRFSQLAIDLNQQTLQPIRKQYLLFSINGYFTETSSREVINQYYHLTQQALRVEETFRTTQRIFRDVESSNDIQFQQQSAEEMKIIAKQLQESTDIVAHVQTKVEWLEVFFVSYYCSALAYYISYSAKFDCFVIGHLSYQTLSIIGWAMAGGLFAFLNLSPHLLPHRHEHQNNHISKQWYETWQFKMFIVLFVWGIWLFVGTTFYNGCGKH